MIGYRSTRGGDSVSLEEAVAAGLAPDGGLYVPNADVPWPATTPPRSSLADVAAWAAPSILPTLDPEDVERAAAAAFDFSTPLVEVEPGVHVLELFHGPTHAFKDVGARFLAELAGRVLPAAEPRTVLVATSGDTGGAVADAFAGKPDFRVVVLFPERGVSDRQRRQMTTLGDQVTAVAVRGSFDDCQRLVKEAFLDPELRRVGRLTSANSINLGRFLPQSLYYVLAAARLGWAEPGPRFVVPSGNLGNLCAGLLAKRMGMPSRPFIAAMNRNRAFVDYVNGEPFQERPVERCDSNAMDVARPSNLERVEWLYGDRVALRRDLVARSISDAVARECARALHERVGYVLDPHTAVAYAAADRTGVPGSPTVVLATAHPAKFPEFVRASIGVEVEPTPTMRESQEREERMVHIPADVSRLADILRRATAP